MLNSKNHTAFSTQTHTTLVTLLVGKGTVLH